MKGLHERPPRAPPPRLSKPGSVIAKLAALHGPVPRIGAPVAPARETAPERTRARSEKETQATPTHELYRLSLHAPPLEVGPADAPEERDAERAADAILSGAPAPALARASTDAAPPVRRACACGGRCDGCRRGADDEDHTLRRSPAGAGPADAPPIVHDVLASPGRPLDAPTRAFMEPRFGHAFARVRVHDDARAAESARAVGAEAYAVGDHLVFAQGRYAPGSRPGLRLLAHELAHVVQDEGRGAGVRRLRRYRSQASHAGLFELLRHDPLGGPTFTPVTRYAVRIRFTPFDLVDCTRIALTQSNLSVSNGQPLSIGPQDRARQGQRGDPTQGWSIDRPEGHTWPYYGAQNDGQPGVFAVYGRHARGEQAQHAELQDTPGTAQAPTIGRPRGTTLSMRFETCAVCGQGADEHAYYGCVEWGFQVGTDDRFEEIPFRLVSAGTPSRTFRTAARRWNDQSVPATQDLPIPTHASSGVDLMRTQIRAEIDAMTQRLPVLSPQSADARQIQMELRALTDALEAIEENEGARWPDPYVRHVQTIVGAIPQGVWTYDTILRLKGWQARNRLPTSGRLDTATRAALDAVLPYPPRGSDLPPARPGTFTLPQPPSMWGIPQPRQPWPDTLPRPSLTIPGFQVPDPWMRGPQIVVEPQRSVLRWLDENASRVRTLSLSAIVCRVRSGVPGAGEMAEGDLRGAILWWANQRGHVVPPISAVPDPCDEQPGTPASTPGVGFTDRLRRVFTAAIDGVGIERAHGRAVVSVRGATVGLRPGVAGATAVVETTAGWTGSIGLECNYRDVHFTGEVSGDRWEIHLAFPGTVAVPMLDQVGDVFRAAESAMRCIVDIVHSVRHPREGPAMVEALRPHLQPVRDAITAARGLHGGSQTTLTVGMQASGPGWSPPGSVGRTDATSLVGTITVVF